MKPGLVLSLVLLPAIAAAQDADMLALGRQSYLDACAGCHGEDARGGGPNAALLSVPVPDLTGIAARNEGVYDPVRIIYLIDGRAGLTAHGGPMPMFGGHLTGQGVVIDAPDGSPVETTAPILAITRWLETLQVP